MIVVLTRCLRKLIWGMILKYSAQLASWIPIFFSELLDYKKKQFLKLVCKSSEDEYTRPTSSVLKFGLSCGTWEYLFSVLHISDLISSTARREYTRYIFSFCILEMKFKSSMREKKLPSNEKQPIIWRSLSIRPIKNNYHTIAKTEEALFESTYDHCFYST